MRSRAQARDNMADATALATAIMALTNAIALIRPPPPTPAVYDPFTEDQPFNLATRTGAQSYNEISAPLDEKDIWDGDVATFPTFILALRIRATEGKWYATAPHGILTIAGKDMLSEYHSITDAEIETTRTARTDPRAIQNSRALFQCLKSSVRGNIKDSIFTQQGNLPAHSDGNALLKKLTSFTTVASLQLSLLSFNNILELNPADLEFNIQKINTRLMQLFVLATTQHRTLDEAERVQHTLNAYSKVLQPETWAQWVRTKIDSFEEGNITNCQSFMNTAVMKYNKIVTHEGDFKGSVHSVQEDIVALLSTKTKAGKRKHQNSEKDEDKLKTRRPKLDEPDFIKHFKASDGTLYKIGDTKEYEGKTFHFCNAPTHRNRIKWHTHPADKCRVRKLWLKSKESGDVNEAPNFAATANNAETIIDVDATAPTNADTQPTNVQALLASALNLVKDNVVARDYIAEAMNAMPNE